MLNKSEFSGKVESGRRKTVGGARRSLGNDRGLRLEYAKVLEEELFVHVLW